MQEIENLKKKFAVEYAQTLLRGHLKQYWIEPWSTSGVRVNIEKGVNLSILNKIVESGCEFDSLYVENVEHENVYNYKEEIPVISFNVTLPKLKLEAAFRKEMLAL